MRNVLLAGIKRDGRSLKAIAECAGLDRAQLSRFVAGDRDLVLHNADKLARVLRLHLVPEDQVKGASNG